MARFVPTIVFLNTLRRMCPWRCSDSKGKGHWIWIFSGIYCNLVPDGICRWWYVRSRGFPIPNDPRPYLLSSCWSGPSFSVWCVLGSGPHLLLYQSEYTACRFINEVKQHRSSMVHSKPSVHVLEFHWFWVRLLSGLLLGYLEIKTSPAGRVCRRRPVYTCR